MTCFISLHHFCMYFNLYFQLNWLAIASQNQMILGEGTFPFWFDWITIWTRPWVHDESSSFSWVYRLHFFKVYVCRCCLYYDRTEYRQEAKRVDYWLRQGFKTLSKNTLTSVLSTFSVASEEIHTNHSRFDLMGCLIWLNSCYLDLHIHKCFKSIQTGLCSWKQRADEADGGDGEQGHPPEPIESPADIPTRGAQETVWWGGQGACGITPVERVWCVWVIVSCSVCRQAKALLGSSLSALRQECDTLKEQLEEEQESKHELQRLVSKLNSDVTLWRSRHEADAIQHSDELEEAKYALMV